jgi:hypothetical protein
MERRAHPPVRARTHDAACCALNSVGITSDSLSKSIILRRHSSGGATTSSYPFRFRSRSDPLPQPFRRVEQKA